MRIIDDDRIADWEERHEALHWFEWQWLGFWAWLMEPLPFPRDDWYDSVD